MYKYLQFIKNFLISKINDLIYIWTNIILLSKDYFELVDWIIVIYIINRC